MDVTQVWYRLYRVRSLEQQIQRKLMTKAELESCLYPGGIRYDRSKVKSEPNDKLFRITAQLMEIDTDIKNLKRRKAAAVQQTADTIELLEDETEKMVLTGFFVARMSIPEIAEMIHYSPRRTYYFRKSALDHLAEKLGKNCKEPRDKMIS